MHDSSILTRRVAVTLSLAALLCIHVRMSQGEETPEKAPSQEELLEHGKSIYQKTCAVCHGESGEGVEKFYPDPLVGDLSVGALADVIAETMPEDDPESCVGPEAHAVASFIHGAFYGEAVRKTSEATHAGLSRLTRTQLRQSLADLYAYDSGVVWSAQDRGLRGLYYDGAGRNERNKRIERTDRTLDFDFGHDGPGQGIDPQDFFIDWRGTVKVDTTGAYEIIIRSTCAFVCYLGEYDRKFIDNHVQSGDKTEFRRSILLTAGRLVPMRIEFFQRKRKTEQPPARISLSWKPPLGVEQVIPERNLAAVDTAPPTFSLQTELPPDDRTYGYERGITVDRQWDESTTAAALEFAQIAADELWPRHQQRNRNTPDENRAVLRNFLTEIIETAFRGPLGDDDRKTHVDQPIDAEEDDLAAIQRAILLALKSPRFLYPNLDQDRSKSQRAANRLALTLFDSLPVDKWLVQLARGNKLEEEQQIQAAARRMLYDYRTESKVRDFLHQWLNIQETSEIVKDEERFAGFDSSLVDNLRTSLDAFLDDVVWSDASDYRTLFQSDWTYTNEYLAKFYGELWRPVDGDGQALRRSVGDAEHRFGVLTHPYLMSKLSHHDTTSPIHRGVFLVRGLLGRTLRPPQEDFTPLAPELHPDLTTRQRVSLQTSPQNCQVCHTKINGLGFTLENFDAVGRYRVTENDRPIDATGSYTSRDGEAVQFEGPRQLADFLANSRDAHEAFVNKAFQHFVKQPPTVLGPDTLQELTSSFDKNDCNIRQLILDISVLTATRTLQSEEGDKSDETSNDQT